MLPVCSVGGYGKSKMASTVTIGRTDDDEINKEGEE